MSTKPGRLRALGSIGREPRLERQHHEQHVDDIVQHDRQDQASGLRTQPDGGNRANAGESEGQSVEAENSVIDRKAVGKAKHQSIERQRPADCRATDVQPPRKGAVEREERSPR